MTNEEINKAKELIKEAYEYEFNQRFNLEYASAIAALAGWFPKMPIETAFNLIMEYREENLK